MAKCGNLRIGKRRSRARALLAMEVSQRFVNLKEAKEEGNEGRIRSRPVNIVADLRGGLEKPETRTFIDAR